MPIFDPKDYQFFYSIEVRYSDLGPRKHVNNARYLNYLEEARIAYRKHLGLPGEVGVILADTHISYHQPVFLEDEIKVGVRVSRMGNKSMLFEHVVVDAGGETVYASAEVVMVAYDYETEATIPIPDEWRERIAEF